LLGIQYIATEHLVGPLWVLLVHPALNHWNIVNEVYLHVDRPGFEP